ncbi:DUF1566 domain-containing protein [Myxococcota bacterium]|nr:DUF1566 domain-containing protein [Myxococcota bacterium]
MMVRFCPVIVCMFLACSCAGSQDPADGSARDAQQDDFSDSAGAEIISVRDPGHSVGDIPSDAGDTSDVSPEDVTLIDEDTEDSTAYDDGWLPGPDTSCDQPATECRVSSWDVELATCVESVAADGTPCRRGVCIDGACQDECWPGDCPSWMVPDPDSCRCRVAPTGSDVCLDGVGHVNCGDIHPGDPWFGQDAQVAGGFRYYTDNGDGTVTDNRTGLVWAKALSNRIKLEDAESFCKVNNGDGDDGLPGDDWRAPAIQEAFTLVDAGDADCMWDAVFGSDCSSDTMYWTSTSAYLSANFCTTHGRGNVEACEKGDKDLHPVRCVRSARGSEVAAEDRFVPFADVVYDRLTGLAWENTLDRDVPGWPEAMQACSDKGPGWRLPTTSEILSIVDVDAPGGDCAKWYQELGEFCPGSESLSFWSSTPTPFESPPFLYAFGSHMAAGHIHDAPTLMRFVARCVNSFAPSGFAALGIPARLPGSHEIAGAPGPVADLDYVCTFAYGDIRGYLYVQSTPVSYDNNSSYQFQTVGAWVAAGGNVTPVEASYGWGGHHHIDWILLKFNGLEYRYHHSSFGWGWKPCQPPDCLQVFDGDGQLVQDGCEPVRSLPVVCRQVRLDGTFDALEDDFEICDGDPDKLQY